jgi:class 3 adenylate cyclase
LAIPPGRLEVIRQKLAGVAGSRYLPRLIEAIETLPDEELDTMRPFAFADFWKADRREVLKLFLHASRAGLIDLSWDVICPSCRGAQERYASLKRLRSDAHCPACNIRYDADFAESVEVRFRPNPAIRRVEIARYCSGGPMNAPHVIAQQQIPAAGSRTLQLRLRPWNYQVRSLKLEGALPVRTASDAEKSAATVRIRRRGFDAPALELTPDMALTLQNDGDQDITVMIERVAGDDNAATAATVIAMSEFRTLFSEEVLSPDTPVSVGAVTLVFTDLKGSTNMYEEIGDASAFAYVQRHFDLLTEAVAKFDGAVVKTIGDAVMAVFLDPARAVEAAFEMHRIESALGLKIGIHHGPCIAVNLNGILDYFGAAVNLAARVQKESRGRDLVVTKEVWKDPQVQAVLKSCDGCEHEVVECALRGVHGIKTIHRLRLL